MLQQASFVQRVVLVFSTSLGICSAARSLSQDQFPCGQLLPDKDIFGEILNEGPAGIPSIGPDNCLALCIQRSNCNAFTVAPEGACFLKSIRNGFPVLDNPGSAGYILCADQILDEAVAPVSAPPDAPTGQGPEVIVFNEQVYSDRSLNSAWRHAEASLFGRWGDVIQLPLVPVASALLTSGQILMWSGSLVDDFSTGVLGDTYYAVLDPETESTPELQRINLAHNMFCPGIARLRDGEVLVVGGSLDGDGAGSTSVFSPGWSQLFGLNIPRGYNSAVTLASGEVFTLGGSFSGNMSQDKGGEMFTPSTGFWRTTPNILGSAILSDDPEGIFRTDNYGFFFAWTGNSVFHAGPSRGMFWFTDLEGAGAVTPAGERGPTAMNGNAVMYQAGKILTVGGAPSFSLSDPARTGAEVITLGEVGDPPLVEKVPGPNIPRTYCMSVVLPTGEVAVFGGSTESTEFSDIHVLFEAEIWNPITQTFSITAANAVPRTYHSSAVLLHDGRVFVGGGGFCGGCNVNHLDAEIFSPPYLFDAAGLPAERPQAYLNAATARPGGPLIVYANEPLAMVSMIRIGADTHSINPEQRRLELCGASTAACPPFISLVTIPSPGVAIPGAWMVFAMNGAGVPSVAADLVIV